MNIYLEKCFSTIRGILLADYKCGSAGFSPATSLPLSLLFVHSFTATTGYQWSWKQCLLLYSCQNFHRKEVKLKKKKNFLEKMPLYLKKEWPKNIYAITQIRLYQTPWICWMKWDYDLALLWGDLLFTMQITKVFSAQFTLYWRFVPYLFPIILSPKAMLSSGCQLGIQVYYHNFAKLISSGRNNFSF